MKLVAAKCPSCGASIDVDKDSDSTKCEYCHSRILVEEAIEKIKIDVEIKNLPVYENYVKLGDRYYSESLYEEARVEYKKALELNPNDSQLIFREKLCRACTTNFNTTDENLILNAFNEIKNSYINKDELNKYVSECLKGLLHIVSISISYHNSVDLYYDGVIRIHVKVLNCSNIIKYFDDFIDKNNSELRLSYLEILIISLHFLATDLIYKDNGTRKKAVYYIPFKEKREYVSNMKRAKEERNSLFSTDESLINKSILNLPKTNYFSNDMFKGYFIILLVFNIIVCAISWGNKSYLIAILCGLNALYQGKNIEILNKNPYSIKEVNLKSTVIFIITIIVFFIMKGIPSYIGQWENDNMIITINQSDASLKFKSNDRFISGKYDVTCDKYDNCTIKLSGYTFYYSNKRLCLIENKKCTQTLEK